MTIAARLRDINWAVVVTATMACVGIILVILAVPALEGGPNWGLDYLAYRDAALRLGAEGSLYASTTLSGSFHPGPTGLYLYPPALAIAVTPLSWWSFDEGARAWYVLHGAFLAAACVIMPVRPSIRLAMLGIAAVTFAVLRDFTMGNVSVLLLLPLAVGWRWLDRPLGSVALALAASVRITYGVFLLWLLLRRTWASALWMIAAGIGVILLTLPYVGLDGYLDYVTTLRNVADTTGVLRNSDLASAALAMGVPRDLAGWALVPGFVAAVGAILLSLRRDAEVGFMVTLSGSLLLAPLLWDHYLAVLSLPAAFLAQRGRPWGLLLPLLSWLPAELLPLVALLATYLPFLARDAETPNEATPAPAGRWRQSRPPPRPRTL